MRQAGRDYGQIKEQDKRLRSQKYATLIDGFRSQLLMDYPPSEHEMPTCANVSDSNSDDKGPYFPPTHGVCACCRPRLLCEAVFVYIASYQRRSFRFPWHVCGDYLCYLKAWYRSHIERPGRCVAAYNPAVICRMLSSARSRRSVACEDDDEQDALLLP